MNKAVERAKKSLMQKQEKKASFAESINVPKAVIPCRSREWAKVVDQRAMSEDFGRRKVVSFTQISKLMKADETPEPAETLVERTRTPCLDPDILYSYRDGSESTLLHKWKIGDDSTRKMGEDSNTVLIATPSVRINYESKQNSPRQINLDFSSKSKFKASP